MRKKLIALLCAVNIVCMMTACGAAKEEDVQGQVVATADAKNEATEAVEDKKDESSAAEENSTQAEETTAAETTEESDEQVTLGSNQNNVYENTYFGIGCELDSEWTCQNDEEIRETNQFAADMMGDEYAEILEQGTNITDMVAVHSNGTDTVNVGIEKLTGGAMLVDEKKYIEVSLEQVEGMLSSMGLENIKATQTEVEFAGGTHAGMLVEGEYQGTPLYEQLVCLKKGSYMLCATVCTWQENTTDDVLSNFYGLE